MYGDAECAYKCLRIACQYDVWAAYTHLCTQMRELMPYLDGITLESLRSSIVIHLFFFVFSVYVC